MDRKFRQGVWTGSSDREIGWEVQTESLDGKFGQEVQVGNLVGKFGQEVQGDSLVRTDALASHSFIYHQTSITNVSGDKSWKSLSM